MSARRAAVLLVAGLLPVGALGACGSDDGDAPATTTTAGPGSPNDETTDGAVDGAADANSGDQENTDSLPQSDAGDDGGNPATGDGPTEG